MYEPRNWVLGKHLTSLNVYTGTRNADGTVTWSGTASTLAKRVDYIRVNDQRVLEMIQSVDTQQYHYEQTGMDSSLVVGEILQQKQGTVAPVLPGVAQGFSFLKVVFTRGGQTYTYLGTIRDFSDGIAAMGKNACEMTLAPIDDGTNPPLALT